MSTISAPELLRTPKGYSDFWKGVFESLVAPIILVRAINERSSTNAIRDRCAGEVKKPYLTLEDCLFFRGRAIPIRSKLFEILDQINGVSERTWRAGREINSTAGSVLYQLEFELAPSRIPAPPSEIDDVPSESPFVINEGDYSKRLRTHFVECVRLEIVEQCHRVEQIPLLEALRHAIYEDSQRNPQIAATGLMKLPDVDGAKMESISDGRPVKSTAALAEQTDPVTRAIALLLAADKEGKRLIIKDLLEIVGCSRSTLYRDPQFNATVKALKAKKKGNIPKGSKTKDGQVEAVGYDPEDE
jgi:hypothetical protein